jgi:hypothetical protein
MAQGDRSEEDRAAERAVVERWFVRRGVPHFIHHYTATRNVFTRTTWPLIAVFLAELGAAFNFNFSWWQNGLAYLGAMAAVLLFWAGVNRLRGRHPLALPRSFGPIELTIFVLLPPLVPEAFGLQGAQALLLIGGNLALLVVVYAVTSYGVLPILRWALLQTLRQLVDLANLLVKSLPLMLLFSMFIFLSADVWQVVADISTVSLAASVGLLLAVGSAFVLLRLPRELTALATFGTWAEVRQHAAGTPLAELVPPAGLPEPGAAALRKRERLNLGLMLFLGQAVQVLLVTAAIGVFYVAFGLFALPQATLRTWTGAPPHLIGPWSIAGNHLSRELLISALLVAAVSGLQFTVAALTDATYREEFYADVTRDLRTTMAVRTLYRAQLTGTGAARG